MDDYRIEITRVDQLVASLVYAQARGRIGRPAMLLLRLLGVDARPQSIGPGLHLPHSTTGLVIHPSVRIGSDVTIWHGVTVGRADVWRPAHPDTGIVIGDGVILGAGAAVLVKAGEHLNVAAGTIVGANAVLTQSTGTDEIWAGNPARKVGVRQSG